MDIQINEEILQAAIDKWGEDHQIEMMIEECIELALALQKLKRQRTHQTAGLINVIDELADVTIMTRVGKIIFDKQLIQERADFKMNRLQERILEGTP